MMEVDVSFCSYNSVASCSSGGELESDLGREALREICCSSLSRILDLPDNKLEILLGEEDEDDNEQGNSASSNVAKNIAHKLKALSHRLRFDDHHNSGKNAMETTGASSFPTLQFGTSIDVPGQDVLVKLMTHIETFSNEEGIFRKSGSHSRIEQMISDLGSLPFESVASNPSYSPPDFSSVLKHYFKELPEPLLLRKHLEAYRQASDMDDEKRMLCLQLLMLLLPPTHHIVLTHLLHLLSIVSHSETSLMTPHNLAVVFGPTLFLHKTLDDVMGEVLPKVTSLLEYMIMHNVEIFEIPVEVRLVAEKYMKRREISEDTTAIPVDIYSSACKKTCSTSEFHEQGRDNAVAELASLYEYVKKMPDGPQKQMFLKKFETGSKMAGTPPPYIKSKKTKENKATPKLPKAVGSHQVNATVTPMRPVFKKGFQLLGTEGGVAGEVPPAPSYATPLRPTANLVQYERMETDV